MYNKAFYDERATASGHSVNSAEFAKSLDEEDPLKGFRSKFLIPDAPDGSGRDKCLYFVGEYYYVLYLYVLHN